MEDHPNTEMKEMMEEMAEDLGRTQMKEKVSRRRISSILTTQGQILLYGSIAIILIILILNVFLIFGGENRALEKKLSTITAKVERLEKGFIQLDRSVTGKDTFEKKFKNFERSLSGHERSLKALGERISQLGQETARLRKKISAAGVKKATTSTAKKRSHTVRKGETLFGIAKKYGVAVDEMRRINKMSRGKDIYPGQKLIIP
ncbi:MAG: LysM peptidoglycan-binding domain-containing protein [Deltaproteobacteria bacterium]|nr:LysM peptidoglycan-binding domain-containing protein [Deltaproteobacteria bacterium]